jgi:excisionase family DNA binding protein
MKCQESALNSLKSDSFYAILLIAFCSTYEVSFMNENYIESWIGIEEAAAHLGVTKDTVRNWIKKTDIPANKIGKLWKFKKSELDEWVKSGKSAI